MTNTFVFCIIELDVDEEEAESQTESLYRLKTTARKQSLLPKGNLFINLLHIRSNMTNTFVFCILEFDEDKDDDEENLSSEDNDSDDDDDDEDYEANKCIFLLSQIKNLL